MVESDGSRTESVLEGLLADTWWYGLTSRLSSERFLEAAHKRVVQGFSAVQIVVGIPPEVGPLNHNARSDSGFPWNLAGEFNREYVLFARDRIAQLNELGLKVIVYGAWGQQIEWLGRDKMGEWWTHLISALDHLDVAYCLTGESNIWLDTPDALLPDRTTGNLARPISPQWLPYRVRRPLGRIRSRLRRKPPAHAVQQRRADWSDVLAKVAVQTNRPILIHTLTGETGVTVVDNGHLLAANTIQTGHSETARDQLWQIPLRECADAPQRLFLNLEPWYEGISDRFRSVDQIYAYWVSMMAGTCGYCYGAHGIWNVGDGEFLAHWGRQTFDTALALDTPRLIGLSHRLLLDWGLGGRPVTSLAGGDLMFIGRESPDGRGIYFYPERSKVDDLLPGRYWLPMAGRFSETAPRQGSVVVLHMP